MFVAVAMDAGGVKVARPIYEKAGVKFTALVDPQNALSEGFGFDVVPNGFLIDEAGVLRYKKVGGFEVKSPATIKQIEEFLALPRATGEEVVPEPSDAEQEKTLRAKIEADPRAGSAYLELGKLLLRQERAADAMKSLEKAIVLMPKSSSAWFNLGSALLAVDRKKEAVVRLREALRLDRSNFVIRKQIWAIEHPDKFYPTIDWGWQREQLAREREAEKLDPPTL